MLFLLGVNPVFYLLLWPIFTYLFTHSVCGSFVFGLNGITLPCVLSFHAWPSSLLGDRCPSSAHQDTAGLPEDFPCRLNPPTVRPWSLASSAPRTGLSCCCSLWAVSDWRRLCGGDINVYVNLGVEGNNSAFVFIFTSTLARVLGS